MNWQYTPYVWPWVLAAITSAGLVYYAQKYRPAPGTRALSGLMLATSVWSLGYVLEISGADLAAVILGARVQYLGACFVPVAWLAFALTYTGRGRLLTRTNMGLLSIVPAVVLFLVLTNDASHELIWRDVALSENHGVSLLTFSHGSLYWLNFAYAYLLLGVSTYLLVQSIRHASFLYREQSIALLIGLLLPWITNVHYLTGFRPFLGLDMAPLALTLSGAVLVWGLFGSRLLNVIPVARDAMVESMRDAVIVVDTQNRVIDLNQAAQKLMGVTAIQAIGQLVTKWFALPNVAASAGGVRSGSVEVVLGKGQEARSYDLRVTPLTRRSRLVGRLAVLYDITERKQTEDALRRSEETARALLNAPMEVALMLDADGAILALNEQAAEALGHSQAKLIGCRILDLIPAESAQIPIGRIEDVLRTGQPHRFEYMYEGVWYDVRLYPVSDSEGLVTRIAVYGRDITRQKRIEREIQSLARFPSENPTPVLRVDTDGRVLYTNLAGEVLLQPSKGGDELALPTGWQTTVDRVIAANQNQVVHHKARGRVFICTFVPIPEFGYVNVYGRDITELEQALTAVQESETRYRELFEGVDDAIFVHDVEGKILDVNEAACRRTGYAREELLQMTTGDLDAPDFALGFKHRLARQLGEGKLDAISGIHITKDGRRIFVDVNTKRINYRGEAAVLAVARDITQRKLMEEALKYRVDLERLITTLSAEFINLSPDEIDSGIVEALHAISTFVSVDRGYVILFSDDGAKIDISHAWHAAGIDPEPSQLLQLSASSVPWWTERLEWFEPVHIPCVADMPPEASAEKAILEARDVQSLLILPIFFLGAVRGFVGFESVRKRKTWDPDVITLLTVVSDIFANALVRKHAEIERERLIAELDAFAHTVAHDLKNPLGVILGLAETIEEDIAVLPEQDLQEFLQGIAWNSRKGVNIIDELLLLAGIRQLDEVFLVPLDMAKVVSNALRRLDYMIDEHAAEIVKLPNDIWPMALGYAPWVEEVWANYLSNAIKYGGRPPYIELGATVQNDGMARFWVRDSGPGIPSEEQERIFTPFTQLSQVQVEGHGLGLSIVHRIVHKLGGQVGVESDPAEGGSTFYFTLPAATGNY